MAISPTSPPVKGFYYKTEVTPTSDGGLETITSKSSTASGTFAPVTSTIVDKTGKAGNPTFDFPGANAADRAAFSNLTSEESKSRNTQIGSTKPFGNNPTAEQQKVFNGAKGTPNAATNSPSADGQTTPPPTSEQSAAAAKEASSFKTGTRRGGGSYATNMKYPINLQSEVQDVIRFSILEYSPSLAKENRSESGLGSGKSRVVTLEGNNPIIKGSTRIGMITLPIPAGISDSNTAGWQQGEANALQMAGIGAVDAFFSGSTPEQVGQGLSQGGEAVLESRDLSAAVRGFFVYQLTNT